MKSCCVILRIAFGLVFVYASLSKIADPQGFAVAVMRYRILPLEMVNLVAIVLPWIEAVCGVALVIGFFPRGAAVVLNLLMAVFLAALVSNIVRGLNVACGCFDPDSTAKSSMTLNVLRDVALFSLGLLVLGMQQRNGSNGNADLAS